MPREVVYRRAAPSGAGSKGGPPLRRNRPRLERMTGPIPAARNSTRAPRPLFCKRRARAVVSIWRNANAWLAANGKPRRGAQPATYSPELAGPRFLLIANLRLDLNCDRLTRVSRAA